MSSKPESAPAKNFAVLGVGGFVAPRHLKAIQETGNRILAAADPHDAVGILDRYSFDIRFFKETEQLQRLLEVHRGGTDEERIHYVSICTPNYLHDAHIRMALRAGADAICEKPLVIDPASLDQLEGLERETGRRVHTILQLRVHPALIALREKLRKGGEGRRHQVELTYITSRGRWYGTSWKGFEEKSGGLGMNIGIHFFDMLLWFFGPVRTSQTHLAAPDRMGGRIELENADVRWFLSLNAEDLPQAQQEARATTFRSIEVDGEEVEFTSGFTDLHTEVYRKSLSDGGFGIEAARPSIELVHRIRHTKVAAPGDIVHPFVAKKR